MDRRTMIAVCGVALLACAGGALVLLGGGGSAKAEKAAAKRAKDAGLMTLSYPKSTGAVPRTMEVRYDPTSNRTVTTLTLTGMRIGGSGAAAVRDVTLRLISSHKGRERAVDDPEGSLDGSLTATAATTGVLAYSGPPGAVVIDGGVTNLKPPSSGEGYVGSAAGGGGGREEVVRFRVATEAVVAAAVGKQVVWKIGTIEAELSAAQIDDLRELAARLNPRP